MGDRRVRTDTRCHTPELLKDGPALVTELTAIRRDPPPFDPPRIGVPVVVAWGSATLERHRRGSEWLASAVPHAVSHIVQGAGHDGHRTHSKEISELVLAAAGRVAAESATPRVPT